MPGAFYGREASVRSLMVEVNRAAYMDEETGAPLRSFDLTTGLLRELLTDLLEQEQARRHPTGRMAP